MIVSQICITKSYTNCSALNRVKRQSYITVMDYLAHFQQQEKRRTKKTKVLTFDWCEPSLPQYRKRSDRQRRNSETAKRTVVDTDTITSCVKSLVVINLPPRMCAQKETPMCFLSSSAQFVLQLC